jgi:hypothetical protein
VTKVQHCVTAKGVTEQGYGRGKALGVAIGKFIKPM